MLAGETARKYGAIVTFMAKPFADRTGSGAHMHYHLADAETGRNLFAADDDARGLGLSELAYHFLGGVLAHARALCAVTSPTVNCYKRLADRSGPDRHALRLHLDAGLHHLRRQQPHADDPHAGGRPRRGPHRVVGVQSLPGLRRLSRRGPGRHPPPASIPASRTATTPTPWGWKRWRGASVRLLPQSLAEASDELERDEVIQAGAGADRRGVHASEARGMGRVSSPGDDLGTGTLLDVALEAPPLRRR